MCTNTTSNAIVGVYELKYAISLLL